MSENEALNALWLMIGAILVLIMQGGFLCLESGLTRSKNAINVALKNAFDLLVAAVLFWLFGFGIMFGDHQTTWLDTQWFAADFTRDESVWHASFFFFQLTFCATAATIVSGAIAERTRFITYILLTILISLALYPVFGHWAWSGVLNAEPGWLESLGFVDFAGSTVVHSVGGWVALAAVIVVGPRRGRFEKNKVRHIPGSNLPLSMLGMLFFIIGWIGFNGGSTLGFTKDIPGIVVNTLIAAASGGIVGMLLGHASIDRNQTTPLTINGTLAGLVAITAGCHAVSTPYAAVIGATGAVVMVMAEKWMLRMKLDDAISAVPVHLAAGIWGTLAVALLGDPERLGTGLSQLQQFQVQLTGIVACALYVFPLAYLFLMLVKRFTPLRVTEQAEKDGLNVSEHGARTELSQLLNAMQLQERMGDMKARVPVEPFTEVGQIAAQYNRVMATLNRMVTRTRLIVRDMRDGVITFSESGMITSANPGMELLFKRASTDIVGQPASYLLHDDCIRHFPGVSLTELLPRLASSHHEGPHELMARDGKGQPFAIEVTTAASPTEDGVQYSAVIRDISERKKMEVRLHRQSELAQVTLEAITEAVITCDDDMKVVYLNPMASRLTAWGQQEAFGRQLDEVVQLYIGAEESVSLSSLCNLVATPTAASGDYRQFSLVNKHGERAEVQLNFAPLHDHLGKRIGWVIAIQDITQHSHLQAQLTFQAVHDTLTGLVNRREFERRLDALISEAQANQSEHLICYLDLDQFKLVNDTCGHRAGDVLLKQLSALLKPVLRQTDTLARLGGDEFGALLSFCPLEQGMALAESLRKVIADFRFSWEGQVFSVGVSIGIVRINGLCGTLDEVLSNADTACYTAKDLGRNRVHIYEPDNREVIERQGQIQWGSRIQDAIDQDSFRLFFQTIRPLDKTRANIPHYEILIRLLDDQQQIVPPGAFIPAAERFGLMPQIDRWVIRNTLAWMGDQIKQRSAPLFCSINLSGTSIGRKDVLDCIREQIRKHSVPAEYICFEITETAAMSDPAHAGSFIQELKQLGCQFALDDFGSGLSSFGYLKLLPVDYLKIDGIFIRDLADNVIDQAMVDSINSIGHIMGLKTIAECVENEETLKILQVLGVDYVQGFHISRPAPLETLSNVRVMPR